MRLVSFTQQYPRRCSLAFSLFVPQQAGQTEQTSAEKSGREAAEGRTLHTGIPSPLLPGVSPASAPTPNSNSSSGAAGAPGGAGAGGVSLASRSYIRPASSVLSTNDPTAGAEPMRP